MFPIQTSFFSQQESSLSVSYPFSQSKKTVLKLNPLMFSPRKTSQEEVIIDKHDVDEVFRAVPEEARRFWRGVGDLMGMLFFEFDGIQWWFHGIYYDLMMVWI